MEILQNKETEKAIAALWKKYLAAEIVNDIIMEGIRDRLYLEHMDPFTGKDPAGKNSFLTAVAETAFGDTLEEIIFSLFNQKKSMLPYSELTDFYGGKDLYDLLLGYTAGQLRQYDNSIINENLYYKKIKFPHDIQNKIELKTADTLPFEFFQTYHVYQKKNPFLYADAGFFTKKTSFPVILENNRVWMSVVVSEIESMKAPIEAARGKVVTYGLGLGYYAFMASEKPSVESVTVVEMNPDVISLFEKNILPQFPHKEKIHICNADAFEFIDRQKDGDFDAAFSDFWGGYFDGLALYRRFFPKTVRFKKTKHFYWIESAFADYFFRPVIMKFLMKKGKHISIPMPSLSKEAEMLQNRFEIYLESKEGILASSDDIYRLLSEETLISLMRDFLKKLT